MESLIKNHDYLQIDTPVEDVSELIYERKEVEEIKNRIRGFFKGSEPAFLKLISGPTGCGKTLSVLYALFSFMKENPEFAKNFIYVNGAQVRTPKALFKYIARQLGARARDNSIASLAEDIEYSLNNSETRKLIVIDEVDKIYKNSRESPKYLFLHSLNRMKVKPRHALLLITNDFNLTKNFDPELSASLIETTFNAYTASDILEILKLRAKFCLKYNSYSMDDLAKISYETYNNPIGGDKANIRHALNILLTAALLAQEKNITISSVLDVAIEQVRVDNYVKFLRKYNKHLLVLIKTLSLLKKKNSIGIYRFTNPDLDYDEIKLSFFKILDAEGFRPLSEAQLRKYIEQLVNEDLLRRINRARYSFLDDADNILEALKKIK